MVRRSAEALPDELLFPFFPHDEHLGRFPLSCYLQLCQGSYMQARTRALFPILALAPHRSEVGMIISERQGAGQVSELGYGRT